MKSATIPESHSDLFEKKSFASIATLMPDGAPQVSVVWVDRDGDVVLVNSAVGRQKDRNIRNDPRVALAITDPEDPYRQLMIRGFVIEVTTEGADAHIDRLAKRYFGVDSYPNRSESEQRVIYRIKPTRVIKMGR